MNWKLITMQNYTELLKKELIPAFGCTEPLCIAYASAKVKEVLGHMPEHIVASCSGNLIKNAHSVVVPGTKELKGVKIASVLGALAGDAEKKLEVLNRVTEADVRNATKLIQEDFCEVRLLENVGNLFVEIKVFYQDHSASVTIADDHTNIINITKDDEIILDKPRIDEENEKIEMSFDSIYDYTNHVPISDVVDQLEKQIDYNLRIAQEGLKGNWSSNIGKLYLEENGNSIFTQAIAHAAAGSDARVGGCELPVVINSGSGDQGITVSVPIIVYANHFNLQGEKLYRSLILGNLLAIYGKSYIGRLSAYCGLVSAASASAAGIAYLLEESKQVVEETFINSLVSISGIFCDGAKPSCSMKMVSSLSTALLAYKQAKHQYSFHPGDGLRKNNADDTVSLIGDVARNGMKIADQIIINSLLDDK